MNEITSATTRLPAFAALGAKSEFVSLGYICSVPSLFAALGRRSTAYVFDRIATPADAIPRLIENDFEDFLGSIETMPVFENSNSKYYVDTTYGIRLGEVNSAGAPLTKEKLQKMISRLQVRKERFVKLLEESDKPILFVRVAEPLSYDDLGKRIGADSAATENHEMIHMRKLSQILKTKYPNLQFEILLMTASASDENVSAAGEDNIYVIPKPDCDFRDIRIGEKMRKHFKMHMQLK